MADGGGRPAASFTLGERTAGGCCALEDGLAGWASEAEGAPCSSTPDETNERGCGLHQRKDTDTRSIQPPSLLFPQLLPAMNLPQDRLPIRRNLSKLFKRAIRQTARQIIPILDETRPGRPLPQLPNELWIIILREATATHANALDTSSGVSFLDTKEGLEQDYLESMRTKLGIALVCHHWNQLVLQFLYEYVWIFRARNARALAQTLLQTRTQQRGHYIRRLHIETSTLERCDASDLRTIIDHSPGLVIYSDQRSVRRGLWEAGRDPRSSSEQILSTLTRPNNRLRRLSWTTYDTDLCFSSLMVPQLGLTTSHLEYLELTVCTPHSSHISNTTIKSPYSYTSFPALRSLKLTLDDATFSDISNWNLPLLTRVSVVAADFSYAGPGFSGFFMNHGPKLVQLELGHSSNIIEEHYLTAPFTRPTIPISEWCPNLKEFICSADAEWNWQSPDWVAPHLLLPHHPNLEFIGIKNMDKRLCEDGQVFPFNDLDDTPFFLLLTQISSLLNRDAFPNLRYIRDLSFDSDAMRTRCPQARISKFWIKVLERCKEKGVWLEDCWGYNVTTGGLKRAMHRL